MVLCFRGISCSPKHQKSIETLKKLVPKHDNHCVIDVHNLNVFLITEKGDEKWDRFITLLGERVRLRGWNRFRGGLDVKGILTLRDTIILLLYSKLSFS